MSFKKYDVKPQKMDFKTQPAAKTCDDSCCLDSFTTVCGGATVCFDSLKVSWKNDRRRSDDGQHRVRDVFLDLRQPRGQVQVPRQGGVAAAQPD